MGKEFVELNARESRTLGLVVDEFNKLVSGEKVISPIRIRQGADDKGLIVNLESLRQAALNKGVHFMEVPDQEIEGAMLLKVIRPPTQERPQEPKQDSNISFSDLFKDMFGGGFF